MKKYIAKVKEKPEQLLFDVLNTALIIFVIGMMIAILQWIINVFKGEILVNPLAIQVGGLSIYWYGIFFVLSFFFGFFIAIKEIRKTGRNIDQTISLVFWTTICGFVGARIAFVLTNWSYYQNDLFQIFNIWQGGLSFFGAVLGGALFILIHSKIRKEKVRQILDIFTLALVFGQFVGRWGNLFNQQYFGQVSDSIRVYISPINRPWTLRNQSFFHPLFLYESIFCFLLFVILLYLKKTAKIKEGFVFLYYLLFYSAFRFGIEFLAIEPKFLGSLTLVQIISIAVFLLSIIGIKILGTKKPKSK